MTTITTLIAEDEPLAAEALADWVHDTPSLKLVATCADGESALQTIKDLEPQLVLLDIEMPALNGLQVLRGVRDAGLKPAVIFTTAYDEHALAAFELHAADYLLKPFSRERFDEAVDHALSRSEAPPLEALEQVREPQRLTRILVRDRGMIIPVAVDTIELLQSDSKYTSITSRGQSYLVRLPITSFEQQLDPQRFLKLHRGCIVNLEFVQSMKPNESSQLVVQMRDGTRITASREVSRKLREQSL
ncbi:LytR/AlgR family response regulator transcription factor [Ramlibacter albus]|uniref:Response regulator transcription factor n=1 Tax=Ramlibacter albus TaxID=2079448 RepID=A0A923M758_9BURK|nr:LytTR family DNA-binding domain-containing protein [Ramlibacter albus]MBC5764605.1 response regulator transcription factor [Ramlibacter albus]